MQPRSRACDDQLYYMEFSSILRTKKHGILLHENKSAIWEHCAYLALNIDVRNAKILYARTLLSLAFCSVMLDKKNERMGKRWRRLALMAGANS